jgi:hypothetical protein
MPELGSLPVKVASAILKALQSKPILPRYLVGNDAAMLRDSHVNDRHRIREFSYGYYSECLIFLCNDLLR